MKKQRSVYENIVHAMEVPADLACRDAVVTLTGGKQAVIENYRSICLCTCEKIVLLTKQGRLVIQGSGLEIQSYTSTEMCICGRITGVFPEKQRGENI